MKFKIVWFLIVASSFVLGIVNAQESEVTDEPPPIEGKADDDIIEGSGSSPVEGKLDVTEQPVVPQLEPIITQSDNRDGERIAEKETPPSIGEEEKINSLSGVVNAQDEDYVTDTLANPPIIDEEKQEETAVQKIPCPEQCLCSVEGEDNNLVVNCAGYSLTEFPAPLDPRTTTLILNNNKLTEIPRDISSLKNLKVFNANDNSIMDIAAGSISELPELVTLKLSNNRLLEYPQDLKNSISLDKLEELDLGGNDIRTTLTPELFSSLKSLRKLTLPITTSELVEDLCGSFKASLETVCTESCKAQSFDCPDVAEQMDAILPGLISFDDKETNLNPSTTTQETTTKVPENTATTEFSLRAAVNEEPVSIKTLNTLIEAPKEPAQAETDVKIGAKTAEIKPAGGVDRSVIGIVIAAMIVIVAVIAIKKNWSSITKKFSSTPRPNERTPTANGTTPEEVPLHEKPNDKSPV